MKPRTTAFLFTYILSTAIVFSQATLQEAQQYITVPGGVQKVDKKVLKNPEPIFIPYIALKFRTGSVGATSAGHGQDRETAKSYAVLDGIDSTLFQEITDQFYKDFTEKLKSAGVTIADFEKVKQSKTYQKFIADPRGRHYDHKDHGTAHVFTNANVPFYNYPTLITKPMKMQKEVEAGLSSMRLTIDFVEFDMTAARTYGWDSRTTSFSANVIPAVKIKCEFQEGLAMDGGTYLNGPGFYMHNEKFLGAVFTNKPVLKPYDASVKSYDSKVPEFANRKFSFFGGGMQLGTFVVAPDPQAYKAAALEALNKYADYIVAVIKSYNTPK